MHIFIEKKQQQQETSSGSNPLFAHLDVSLSLLVSDLRFSYAIALIVGLVGQRATIGKALLLEEESQSHHNTHNTEAVVGVRLMDVEGYVREVYTLHHQIKVAPFRSKSGRSVQRAPQVGPC